MDFPARERCAERPDGFALDMQGSEWRTRRDEMPK